MMFSIYLLIGAIAGILAGLMGIGGGVVIIPALSAVFLSHHSVPADYVMKVAIGTSLAVVIVTASSAVYAHHRRQRVRWDWVKKILPGVFIGALLGTGVAHYLSSQRLQQFFGIFLLYVGLRLLLAKKTQPTTEECAKMAAWKINFFSVLIGTLSSILGVGGGILLIPFLMYCELDMRQIPGTSVACGFVISVVVTLCLLISGLLAGVHVPQGTAYIYWPAFVGIAISSVLFAPVGALLAHRLPTEILKRVFGVFLLVMGINMLW